MRILIADGDKKFREQTQTILLQCGHDAKAAADGLECADILRDFVPEVMVLDCGLHWGGYRGVISLMSENSGLSRILTVLIADEDPRDDLAGSHDPMHLAWLRKPFRLSDLMTLMETGSRSPRSARQIQVVPSPVSQERGVQ
jgi:DNA-binding response OmpR family regulator